MEKKADVTCPIAVVLGIMVLVGDITFGTIMYAIDKINVLTVIGMIVLFIASICLLMLKGKCSADDEGVRIDMPIGRNKMIPYAEITAVTLDAVVGSKTSKYSSSRYVIIKLIVTTGRGSTTVKTNGGAVTNRYALDDPAVKAQFIETSSLSEIAAYIRQRSGV